MGTVQPGCVWQLSVRQGYVFCSGSATVGTNFVSSGSRTTDRYGFVRVLAMRLAYHGASGICSVVARLLLGGRPAAGCTSLACCRERRGARHRRLQIGPFVK